MKPLRKEILAGNRQVIDALYQEVWNELIYFFANRGVEEADAQDIFGTVFLAFLHKVRLHKIPDDIQPKKFITGMVKNELRNFFKRKTRRLEVMTDYKLHPNIAEAATEYDEEKICRVSEKMEEIDDTCKEILRLYYYERLEPTEILKRLKTIKTVGSLKVSKSRCLQKLKALVKN